MAACVVTCICWSMSLRCVAKARGRVSVVVHPHLTLCNTPCLPVQQYENLTAPDSREAVLADLQRFLGLDPELAPRELPSENSRWAGRRTLRGTHACVRLGTSQLSSWERTLPALTRGPSCPLLMVAAVRRKGKEHPDGWPMRREEYEEFVGIARASSRK